MWSWSSGCTAPSAAVPAGASTGATWSRHAPVIRADGTPYTPIIRRRFRCLDCGQLRIDKDHVLRPGSAVPPCPASAGASCWDRLEYAIAHLDRSAVESWMVCKEAEGMGARTRNTHRAALMAFANWCVETYRLAVNPLAKLAKADEMADCRRKRRAPMISPLRLHQRLHQLLTFRANRRPFLTTHRCIPDPAYVTIPSEYGPKTRENQEEGWSGRRDSNPRPSAWEADTLPLSYARF